MGIEDENPNGERFNNVLRNIFEEYDNNFSWNEINVYDMHWDNCLIYDIYRVELLKYTLGSILYDISLKKDGE